MAAFRIFSKLNTFYGLTAQLLAGGEIRFYDAGTTTPRDVYSDSDLAVNNGPTIDLDSSGRPNVDVWGDGAYFVEVYDSLGVKQGEADDVQIPGAGGQTIPALETGKFLTNNGAVLLWSAIREVPDPTGQSGKFLSTDGESLLWQAGPTLPDIPPPDQEVGTTTLRVGNFLFQSGTGSASASGTKDTSTAVSFGTAYTSILHVGITPTGTVVTASGAAPTATVTGITIGSPATGFTANFNTSDEHGGSNDWTISSPCNFLWFAFGLIAE